MSIKEKVAIEAKKRIEKRLSKVDEILDANPLSEICDLRIKACDILKEHKGNYAKIKELIDPLAEKEKKLFKLAKMQTKNTNKLIDEKVKLQVELYELNNEIFWMKKNKS